jgi:hypothetical protein
VGRVSRRSFVDLAELMRGLDHTFENGDWRENSILPESSLVILDILRNVFAALLLSSF